MRSLHGEQCLAKSNERQQIKKTDGRSLYDKILACCFDVLSICARIHERFQDWHPYQARGQSCAYNCAGKRYSEVYAGSWVWYDHSVHCTAVKEGELVTNQTRNLLRCFGLEMFLVSFETLGEAIDIARESLLEPGYHRDYYSILGDRYGVSRKKINDDIRRAVAVAWRLHRDIMEETLGEIYERPPTPRRFVYAAADYLNKKEVEEMSD